MSGAVVVLSGGLDSTVCLALASRDLDEVVTLTVDYGQRHRLEVDRAASVAAAYGAEHVVV
ncbi:MAG: 7-cyano-7-deazaguanine synthase, partial [Actinomycetota bacterium]|nr:7-cyano-7-deazaguanine synthase [Actinomycetota bacterium]